MGRPKKSAPVYVKPEDESQLVEEEEEPETEEEAEEPATAQNGKSLNKSQAVRAAVDAGHDSPEDGTAYVRQHYGLDIEKQHFSSIKSQYLKKQREGEAKPAKKVAALRKRKPLVEGYVAPPPKPEGEPDVLLALEAIKPLIAEYGADKVKRLVELLS